MPNVDGTNNDATALSRFAALAALTFSCVMLAGVWQVMSATMNPSVLEYPRSWNDFMQGRSTGTLEKRIEEKLPARAALITIANSARYLFTGSGGDQVRTGKDGWLFLTDELRFETDGSTHLKIRAELLGAAARALDQLGVKLVVVLVPDKARVHASKLSGGRYPDYNSARYQDGLDALQRQGVMTVNLLKPLARAAAQQEVYYRTDTHWNQAGARLAADEVASVVHQLGIALEASTFSSNPGGVPVERSGDLIRLMGLEDVSKALGLHPDTEIPVVTRQTSVDSAIGLFGDSAVPVVLTGTSYSLRANFVGFLQQALSTKVLNAARDGGGFLQATSQYLNDDSFKSAKPKVLIWELPERFLWNKLDEEPKWLEKVGLNH